MTTTNEIKVYSPQDVYDSYVREVIESEEVGTCERESGNIWDGEKRKHDEGQHKNTFNSKTLSNLGELGFNSSLRN